MYLSFHNETLNSNKHICIRNSNFKTPFKMLLKLCVTEAGVGQSLQCQIKSIAWYMPLWWVTVYRVISLNKF